MNKRSSGKSREKPGKKPGKLGWETPKLSKREKEILELVGKEGLSYEQAADRLKLKKKTIQNLMSLLRKKGMISRAWETREGKAGHPPFKGKNLRAHAHQWNIRILSRTEKYKRQYENRVIPDFDGNEVRCHNSTIEIYSSKSFFGKSRAECEIKAGEYWTYLFRMLENDLGVEIVRNRTPNIELVKGEIAELENGLAEQAVERKQHLKVRGTEDGRVWLITDNSFKQKELEFKHPKKHGEDCDTIIPFFNDIRDSFGPGEVPKISEVMQALQGITEALQATVGGIKAQGMVIENLMRLMAVERNVTLEDLQKGVEGAKPPATDKENLRPDYMG